MKNEILQIMYKLSKGDINYNLASKQVLYLLDDTPFIISDKEISHAADKWIFDVNGKKWSNNDGTAGDNYGSFMAGAMWMRSKLNGVNDVLHNKDKK